MDALTSLELEAQRRRETVASDRDIGLARAMASTETVEPTSVRRAVVAALAARPAADTDCQPAPLTRQGAG
jgi:hypothetical protein